MSSASAPNPKAESKLQEYFKLAFRNEDLKSDERILSTMLQNLRQIKELLIEKERAFCAEDQRLRSSPCVKESLRMRCFNLIDHLVHYKCLIECLATDILNMESNLIDDDEYLRLSLAYRQVELAILHSIKVNQQRNEIFLNMANDEAQSHLSEAESKWRFEHEERRKLIGRLLFDQQHFVIDKTSENLQQQQLLLNKRYQSINNLIRFPT